MMKSLKSFDVTKIYFSLLDILWKARRDKNDKRSKTNRIVRIAWWIVCYRQDLDDTLANEINDMINIEVNNNWLNVIHKKVIDK